MSKQKEISEVEARWNAFWQEHKDYDSPWARDILHNLSEFLPYVFKFDAIPVGLKQLYVKSGVKFPHDLDWARDWTGVSEHLPASALHGLPIFKLALAFRAYANFGLLPEDDNDSELLTDLLGGMLEFFPRQWGDDDMNQTMSAAVGRWKLDNGDEGLTPDELAALAGVSRKSVMNLIAPGKSGVLQKNSGDRITIESARRWLLARPDFRQSIWQEQKKGTSWIPKPEPSAILEPLFVPVGGDGSWFSPADRHQQDDCYYVSNGADERTFNDYWPALDFLARAASPRWRYADTTGRWRVKTATSWVRKARKEVDELVSGSAQMERKKLNGARTT
jgi:hypothetical protein